MFLRSGLGSVPSFWRPGTERTQAVLDLQENAATEGVARTRWCPLTRIQITPDTGPAVNRHAAMPEGLDRCRASECQLWRWAGVRRTEQVNTTGSDEKPEGDGWECADSWDGGARWVRPRPDREGFCGIAPLVSL